MIRLDAGLVQRLQHRHGGAALRDFGQQAFVAEVQVRHQHKGHAAIHGAASGSHCHRRRFIHGRFGTVMADNKSMMGLLRKTPTYFI